MDMIKFKRMLIFVRKLNEEDFVRFLKGIDSICEWKENALN